MQQSNLDQALIQTFGIMILGKLIWIQWLFSLSLLMCIKDFDFHVVNKANANAKAKAKI
jgi:hypothetical protein